MKEKKLYGIDSKPTLVQKQNSFIYSRKTMIMKKTTVSLAILALLFAGISEVIAQKHIVRRVPNRRTAPSSTRPHKRVYSYKDNYIEGLARVTFKKKWGFIDEKGIEVIPCKYDYVDSFEEGLSMVSFNEKYGFIDKAGIEVVP